MKPGFVNTKMTKDLSKNFLYAEPAYVAKKVLSAYESGKDVVYVPWFWRWIMLTLRLIPERIFKRLKL